MTRDRVTMADIAEALGISKNAVSVALKGSPGVSDRTRDAVKRMADQLGYHRRRAETRLRAVALVFHESLLQAPATLFFGPLIQNLQKQLARRDGTLTLFGVSDDDQANLRLPAWSEGAFEGILALSEFSPLFIHALQKRAPVVWIDHYSAQVACDKVVTENQLGAYEAVMHLIDRGYPTIGFLGDLAHSPSYVERFAGYRQAVETAGLFLDERWVWTEADERASHVEAYWQSLETSPAAWFCANDILAANLLHVVREQGCDVPDDVAIVGFDDLQLAQASTPKITTMHVEPKYYASRAVQVLEERLDHPNRPFETIRVAPELVVRQSSVGAGHLRVMNAEGS